jgi:two-component system, chemotaxis family, sensor kinase CheA
MDPILQKFKEKFYEEAVNLLDHLEQDLLDLENKSNDKELIESAFRAMHTIKGVSGMYGFDFICEFTHSMESIYQAIRENRIVFNKEIFDITFLSVDHIRKLLTDEKLADTTNQANHNQIIHDINGILNSQTNQLQPAPEKPTVKSEKECEFGTWHILLRTDEKIYFRGINLVSIFRELAQLGQFQISRLDFLSGGDIDVWSVFLTTSANESQIAEIFLFVEDNCVVTRLSNDDLVERLQNKEEKVEIKTEDEEESILDYIEKSGKNRTNLAPEPKTTGALDKKEKQVEFEKQAVKRISVDSEKLDHLMYLVSELITVNSQMVLATHGSEFDPIRQQVEKIDNLSKQFRNNALEIRLVPLSDTVLRFQRLIRDLSRQLSKKINLITQGTDTELDKNTIDQLNEPLMHLIRNCIDHGIETPEQRKLKGKAEAGHITISAYHSGNYVMIKVEDDGTGIDTEKVRLKAIDKGIFKPDYKPTRKEIFELIFLPGFSTARSLTEVSGRGVGMDVVRKKIQDLRGDIEVESIEGQGTAFILKLQQSVAIIDTLLFKVSENYFIVPIADINICSQISLDEIISRKHTATLPFNDQLIPFVDLREKLHIGGTYDKKLKAVIVQNADGQLALLTDKIVGEHQAVLKPLGKSLKDQKYVTSASQLGDGNMAFMLDTSELLKQTRRSKREVA